MRRRTGPRAFITGYAVREWEIKIIRMNTRTFLLTRTRIFFFSSESGAGVINCPPPSRGMMAQCGTASVLKHTRRSRAREPEFAVFGKPTTRTRRCVTRVLFVCLFIFFVFSFFRRTRDIFRRRLAPTHREGTRRFCDDDDHFV